MKYEKKFKQLLEKMDNTQLEELSSLLNEELSDRYDEEYGEENLENNIETFIDKAKLIMDTTNHTWGDGEVPTKEEIKDTIYDLLDTVKKMEADDDYKDDEIEVSTGGFEIRKIDGCYELNYTTGIILS